LRLFVAWKTQDAKMREDASRNVKAWSERCEHGSKTCYPCFTCTNEHRAEMDRIRDAKWLAERIGAALAEGNTAELLRLVK
jgi:hypothetical protein